MGIKNKYQKRYKKLTINSFKSETEEGGRRDKLTWLSLLLFLINKNFKNFNRS